MANSHDNGGMPDSIRALQHSLFTPQGNLRPDLQQRVAAALDHNKNGIFDGDEIASLIHLSIKEAVRVAEQSHNRGFIDALARNMEHMTKKQEVDLGIEVGSKMGGGFHGIGVLNDEQATALVRDAQRAARALSDASRPPCHPSPLR